MRAKNGMKSKLAKAGLPYMRKKLDPQRHMVQSVMSVYKGMHTYLHPLAWPPEDGAPLTSYVLMSDYILLPRRRRGEKFRILYTVFVEKEL